MRQSDAASFTENYAKLYFDVEHLEKELNMGWWNMPFKCLWIKSFQNQNAYEHDLTTAVCLIVTWEQVYILIKHNKLCSKNV